MKIFLLALATLSLSVAAGCGSSSTSPGSGTGGSVGTGGSPGTGGATATGGQDGAADGPVLYTLTVQNYLNWCDVTENGTLYAAGVPPVMSFPPDTVVDLNAVANSIFVWGYWTGTDGDKTSAHDMSMATTVTMTSNKTVLACCPDPPPAAPTLPVVGRPRHRVTATVTVPVSRPPGCAGIVTVNVPCGADQSVPLPTVCAGPGLVTVKENVPCAGAESP